MNTYNIVDVDPVADVDPAVVGDDDTSCNNSSDCKCGDFCPVYWKTPTCQPISNFIDCNENECTKKHVCDSENSTCTKAGSNRCIVALGDNTNGDNKHNNVRIYQVDQCSKLDKVFGGTADECKASYQCGGTDCTELVNPCVWDEGTSTCNNNIKGVFTKQYCCDDTNSKCGVNKNGSDCTYNSSWR